MSDRELLSNTVNDLFAKYSPLLGRDEATTNRLWEQVERVQLNTIGTPVDFGGPGGSQSEVATVLRVASRYAPPIPLAESILASWLAASAGLRVMEGMRALAPIHFGALPKFRLSSRTFVDSTAVGVPYAPLASSLVILAEVDGAPFVVVGRPSRESLNPYPNLADEPSADIALEQIEVDDVAPSRVTLDDMLALGAIYRVQQIAGALDRVLEMTIHYSNDRQQFGRPIAKFQAVQHLVAELAEEAVAATVAAESAAAASQSAGFVQVAALAKSRAGKSAAATALAHQVHGAIGATTDHPLHLFTRRIAAWRDEFGSQVEWATLIGSRSAARGGRQLWRDVSLVDGVAHA